MVKMSLKICCHNKNFRINLIYTVIVFFVSVAVFRVLHGLHESHFDSLWRAAYGVLEGRPHWIAYQNRLLGPYLVYFISKMGFSYSTALNIFTLFMVVFQNILLLFLLKKKDVSFNNALAVIFIYSLLFLLVQHKWLYTWDSIDAIIFTLFAYGIIQEKSLRYFLLIFFIELLNRESALFIALYIVIDSFHFEPSKLQLNLRSKTKLVVGFFLIVFGIVYTQFIRHYLFVSRSNNMPDTSHELIGNHIYVFKNIKYLFLYNFLSIDIINSVFFIGTLAYLIYRARSYTAAQIKALLIYCVIMANILIFGLINESRVYIEVLPFLIF